MRRLAFDCSGEARSAALIDGDHTVAVAEASGARAHAEQLVPMLATLMADTGWAWSTLDELVVASGPGSFTGIRLAVATARGLALALDRPVRAVGTLDALLAQGAAIGADTAAIDARRGGLYLATAAGEAFGDPAAVPIERAAALMPARFKAIGSGAALLVAAAGSGVAIPATIRAEGLAAAARRGRSAPPCHGFDLVPRYGRAADAVASVA